MGVLRSLLEEGQFVDVTLACDGRRLKAHKLMLSACSNFFRELLKVCQQYNVKQMYDDNVFSDI